MLLAQVTNVQAVHVPYKGAGPALNDLLGARLDFMATTVPSVLGLAQRGDVKVLAVTSRDRIAKFPNVPSVAESGWPSYESTAWYGFVAPKGTPQPVIDTLREATIATIMSGMARERLENEGAQPIGDTPTEFLDMMKGRVRPLGRRHQEGEHRHRLRGEPVCGRVWSETDTCCRRDLNVRAQGLNPNLIPTSSEPEEGSLSAIKMREGIRKVRHVPAEVNLISAQTKERSRLPSNFA